MQSTSESAVRARAKSWGYYVCKSRDRSTHVDNYGDYQLVDSYHNLVVLGVRFDASLEQISGFLNRLLDVAATDTFKPVGLAAERVVDMLSRRRL